MVTRSQNSDQMEVWHSIVASLGSLAEDSSATWEMLTDICDSMSDIAHNTAILGK